MPLDKTRCQASNLVGPERSRASHVALTPGWYQLMLIMLCLCEPCHPILRVSKCLDGIGCCMMVRYFSSLNWNHSCLLEGWPPKQVSCVWAEDSFERGLLGFADLCLGACHPKSWTGDPLLWHPSNLSSWRWSGISKSSQRMKPFKMTAWAPVETQQDRQVEWSFLRHLKNEQSPCWSEQQKGCHFV